MPDVVAPCAVVALTVSIWQDSCRDDHSPGIASRGLKLLIATIWKFPNQYRQIDTEL
jgi:hypothetical protein